MWEREEKTHFLILVFFCVSQIQPVYNAIIIWYLPTWTVNMTLIHITVVLFFPNLLQQGKKATGVVLYIFFCRLFLIVQDAVIPRLLLWNQTLFSLEKIFQRLFIGPWSRTKMRWIFSLLLDPLWKCDQWLLSQVCQRIYGD